MPKKIKAVRTTAASRTRKSPARPARNTPNQTTSKPNHAARAVSIADLTRDIRSMGAKKSDSSEDTNGSETSLKQLQKDFPPESLAFESGRAYEVIISSKKDN